MGVPGREAFPAPAGDLSHHLYVCSTTVEYRRHIAFRDHLRAHRKDAGAYAAQKRELAIKFGQDREADTKAKSDFVERILWESRKVLSKLDVSPDAGKLKLRRAT
ncbi:MAG TPA: GrpB family protein [Candidatus Dormibacteraeota bacterium]|nr:GrpB family protein [Candidatus Dormibacteraeota bacterium]